MPTRRPALHPSFALGIVLTLAAAHPLTAAEPVPAVPGPTHADLRLTDLRQRVLEENEAIQMKLLEAQVAQKLIQSERGIFEPALVATVDHFDTKRPNNRQQTASLGFFARPFYFEQNTLYSAGIEFLLGTGTKIRTGYALRELDNNIGAPDTNPGQLMGSQFETFLGVNVTQPLLKNFGVGATLAKIRLATLASEVAFEEYRRQTMLVMATAEAAYWDLYLAQEQDRISAESVTTAGKVLADNQARVEVGKSSELEVIQSQAGLAFRKSRQNEARQKAYDGATRLSSLYGLKAGPGAVLPRAVDTPDLVEDTLEIHDSFAQALQLNPDYLIRRHQVAQENLRVAYTKNQRLPQLDLKASWGLNGLGTSVGSSFDDLGTRSYPAWSIGAELRVPLGGGTKERNDAQAAQLSKMRALSGLKEAEIQIINSLDSAQSKARLYRDSISSYRSVADFHEKLLAAQLDRLAVGSTDSRTVLETEEKLFEARVAVVESLVLYRKSLLELEVVRGTILAARSSEVHKDDVTARTLEHLRQARIPASRIQEAQRQAVRDVEQAAQPR